MTIRSATESLIPLVNAVNDGIRKSVGLKFSKIALEKGFNAIDKWNGIVQKIAAVAFSILATAVVGVLTIGIALEVTGRTIKEVAATGYFHRPAMKITGCLSALVVTPGVAIGYTLFSIVGIVQEAIRLLKKAPPPKAEEPKTEQPVKA